MTPDLPIAPRDLDEIASILARGYLRYCAAGNPLIPLIPRPIPTLMCLRLTEPRTENKARATKETRMNKALEKQVNELQKVPVGELRKIRARRDL